MKTDITAAIDKIVAAQVREATKVHRRLAAREATKLKRQVEQTGKWRDDYQRTRALLLKAQAEIKQLKRDVNDLLL